MKKHYAQPFSYSAEIGRGLCGHRQRPDEITTDYREASCLLCVSAMSPGEQAWHDVNNRAWIEHKAKDGRRKG